MTFTNPISPEFPSHPVRVVDGRYRFFVSENTTAEMPVDATEADLNAVGLFERVDNPPTYDPEQKRLIATGNWPGGVREYVVEDLTLEEVKERKESALESDFLTAIASGYDTGLGFRLALRDKDRTAIAQFEQLNSKALAKGLKQSSDTVYMTDINRNPVPIEAGDVEDLLLAYGGYYQGLWTNLATKRSMVRSATTIAEALAVTF